MMSLCRFLVVVVMFAIASVVDAIQVELQPSVERDSNDRVTAININRGYNDQSMLVNFFRLPFCCVRDRYRISFRYSNDRKWNKPEVAVEREITASNLLNQAYKVYASMIEFVQ